LRIFRNRAKCGAMSRSIVLQHVACETPGLAGIELERAGVSLDFVRTFAGEPVPREVGDAAGVLVMGGPMGVYEAARHPHLRDEMALLERAVAVGVPVLGVCLGSQLLAAALGARVAPGPRKEIGWFPVTLTNEAADDLLWRGVDREFVAYHWHGDRFELPRGAVPLASSALTPLQAFRYGESAYGILFHMEVTKEIVGAMVETFAAEVAEERLDGTAIVREAAERLDGLHRVARIVFSRFAAAVSGV
jgi:GMP synthase (glutamine-hydrolysing)